MGNGAQGICMLEEYCKPVGEKSSSHPRPCDVYNVKCCPRNSKLTAVAAMSGTLLDDDEEKESIVNFAIYKNSDYRRQHPSYKYVVQEPRN